MSSGILKYTILYHLHCDKNVKHTGFCRTIHNNKTKSLPAVCPIDFRINITILFNFTHKSALGPRGGLWPVLLVGNS
jgi:hypothetical protein